MSLHQIILFIHLLAMAIAIGIGFSNLVNLRVAKSQTADVARGLGQARLANRPYHDGAILVLVLAGLILLVERGGMAGLSPWFHAKLLFVVVLVVCHFTARYFVNQLIASGNMAFMARAKMFSHIAIVSAVITVFCAVMAFAA